MTAEEKNANTSDTAHEGTPEEEPILNRAQRRALDHKKGGPDPKTQLHAGGAGRGGFQPQQFGGKSQTRLPRKSN